jgi:hypothetical protein
MRQLEHALGLLADRGEPILVDVLVGRLEAELASDATVPDTATMPGQDSPSGPTSRDGLEGRRRRNPWRGPLIAAGTAAVILVLASLSLLFIDNGTGDVIIEPAPTTTTATVPGDNTVVPTPIDAAWSHQGTVDDWLTEPVFFDGSFYATRKGLDEETQQEVDGQVEGIIEDAGELWTSLDGVTWIPAEESERPPRASPETLTDGAAVVVRRNPGADAYGVLVAEGLWATSDGASWREIELRPSQDNWIPSVASGEFGWVVYSPPREATIETDRSSLFQGPRHGNLGLWYTPDTEAWFEVTDLGPLADFVGDTDNNDGEVIVVLDDGEVGVFDAAMIVRDTDILVYVNVAKTSGWVISNPHTEIWQLDLSPGEPTTIATSPTTSLDPTTVTTVAIEAGGWNTVLADTRAKVPPAPATCPPSATPNVPGPSDQARPGPRWVGNLAGAFDRSKGRIVYVDTAGEPWTFDVCTNTWHQMNPNSQPVPDEELYDAAGEPSGVLGQLVYDIDSDVTIALGGGGVSVYDANTNTWSKRAYPPEAIWMLGAVYDPISGMVITSTSDGGEDWDLWAYNVDTDEWTELGPVTVERDTPCCTQIDLLGYSADLDRLILVTAYRGDVTLLVDPRTGEMTIIPYTNAPIVDLGIPNAVFGQANGTVYVYDWRGRDLVEDRDRALCGFDADTLSWACHDAPAEIPAKYVAKYVAFAALTDDPINNRLVLVNGVHGDSWRDATDDVWAVDLDTGEWTQILSPSNQ